MSSSIKDDPNALQKTDTLVRHFAGKSDEIPELTRVVLLCLDPISADTTFHWALDNFIIPPKDLVSKKKSKKGYRNPIHLSNVGYSGSCSSSRHTCSTLYQFYGLCR